MFEQNKVSKKNKLWLLLALAVSSNITAEELSKKTDQNDVEFDTLHVLGANEEGFNVAINAEMIDKKLSTSLQDLFRHEPSITVGGGLPVAQKVYVRGLEDTLLNVTIDGATQAGYIYHHQGRINVEPELIKNVVVKPGAGNATDGAGALGGAIHLNLKDAQDLVRPGQQFGALVKTAYHSNNSMWKKHISAYGMLSDDFGLLASFTDNDASDNYRDGSGNEVEYSEIEQQDIRIKLSGDIADDHYLSLGYENFDDDGNRYSRANMGALFHPIYPNVPVEQKTNRESWTVNYKYNPSNELIDLSTTLYYTDSSLEKNGDQWIISHAPFQFGDVYGDWHGAGVESVGFDLSNVSTIGEHTLEYGYEYREDEAYLVNALYTNNDEETEIHALFLQADLKLHDSVTLSTGARYDNYDYTDNFGVNISDSQLSPNATIIFDINKRLEFSVGYARAFKGVSSPEAFFLEAGGQFAPPTYAGTTLSSYTGPDIITGSDYDTGALKAEESDNFEVGFKYEGESFSASGELYHQSIENAQVISSSTWSRMSYLEDVNVRGYALRMAYFWDDITLDLGVSESKPELGDLPLGSGDMGLGTAYGRTWTLGLEHSPSLDWTLGWNTRLVEELDFVQAGQDNKSGYAVHDIFVQWTPVDRLKVGLVVSNLFDKSYYDQGTFFTSDNTTDPYGLREPGRDIRVSMSYEF